MGDGLARSARVFEFLLSVAVLIVASACSSGSGGSSASTNAVADSVGSTGTSTETTGTSATNASTNVTSTGGETSTSSSTGGSTSAGGVTTSAVTTSGSGSGGSGGGADETYPFPASAPDEDGSSLWLRYPELPIPGRLAEYRAALTHVVGSGASPTLEIAEAELVRGLSGLTGSAVTLSAEPTGPGAVVVGTPESSSVVASMADRLAALGSEGYLVEAVDLGGQGATVVAANTDIGALYGSFALLRHLQSHRALESLSLTSTPKIKRRLLNHWDNLDGSIERGYAGGSLWNWNALPDTLSPRYEEYARANASIGINGAVLNNVNADAEILTGPYLAKVKALADVFRPYGIKVYLTARFSAPIEIGGQSTADPAESAVQAWWQDKAAEIYELIPDFGGFLVKANSEGQPGPGDYGRTHAEGANMLADAVEPFGGIVMWRAFVYSDETPSDRIRQAYDEFKPLDGQFRENVMIQAKNGALDFQPREPFHPLFGGMPETPIALELQVTKEYLGEDTHLAYLGPLYEEVLAADTYADGEGSSVARIVDGTVYGHALSAIAGVANVGSDANWTGSHMNQANWYVFGRLAWDPDASSRELAAEWVRQTFSNDPLVVEPVTDMMLRSRQALVDYMTPLGLVHIMATDHHYGPGPWVNDLDRDDWNPTYYHRADADGIGFDRTASGSNAIEQYFSPVRDTFGSRESVPEDFLLFFHRVAWGDVLASGRSVWEELVYRYSHGVDQVGELRAAWAGVEQRIDAARFAEVAEFLQIQHWEARWWRDACLQYFAQVSGLTIPSGYAAPANALGFYQGLECPADATKPRCDPIYSGEPSPAILP